MKNTLLTLATALLMTGNALAQSSGSADNVAVLAQQTSIAAAQAEIADLQGQLKALRLKKDISVVIAITSATATIASGLYAGTQTLFYGYDGRRMMLSEKLGLVAVVITPAAAAVASRSYATMKANQIDQLLLKLSETQDKLSAAQQALTAILKD